MNYTLYICNHCKGCEKVIGFLREKGIVINEINLDINKSGNSPALLVVPALLINDKIVAYGSDIIEYLDDKK